MLKHLLITNYALIEHAEVEFNEGFTVITGETGAGKSILLEALGMVFGSRANFSAIRKGQEKCVVEATFEYSDPQVDEILRSESLDVLDDLIIRREMTRSGRSRAFVNDSPVSNQILKEISGNLVDLHGQQENLALQSRSYQLDQLDLFAQNASHLKRYEQVFSEYKQISRSIAELKEQASQVRKDEDYFQFQFKELEALNPNEEEFEGLEQERNTLEHSEEIANVIQEAQYVIDENEQSLLSSILSLKQGFVRIEEYSSDLKVIADRIASIQIELDDLNRELAALDSGMDADPGRLNYLRERLDEYQRLMHKHSTDSVGQLISVKEEYALKLQGISNYDEELQTLTKRESTLRSTLKDLAEELSASRTKAIPAFETELTALVRRLGMKKATISMRLTKTDDFQSHGLDQFDLLFDANGDQHLVPLKEAASGGEVSRLMLALKSIIAANDKTPTLIFDEVDTGVSGEVANQIGVLMKAIALNTQIIAVTHLPGVAAKGIQHIRIYKEEQEGSMVSKLSQLSKEERIKEIAAMFSGDQISDASLESARNLLLET